MALSLLCGGLGVASAEVDVKVDVSSAPGAVEVYTKTGVDTLLADYGKKEDVQTNKDDITALQNTTTTQGNQITANTTQIANNTADIEKKIDKEIANATYATKEALNNLTNTVNGKADKTYVDQKFTEAGTSVNTKLEDYYNKAAVDGKITAEATARDTAINTAIGLEREDRDAAIGNAITGEVAARTQAINTAITQEVTARDLAVANAKAGLEGKITEEKTARTAKDLELEGEITQNRQAIETLDKSSVKYDNPVAKDTITLAGLDGTKITRLKDATLSDISTEAVTGKQLYKTNENLAAETTARTDKDTELEKGIAKNSGDITALDGKIKTNADNIQTNADNIKKNKDEIARVNGELVKTNKRTAGIGRLDTGVEANNQTVIEDKVYFDQNGNVSGVKDLKTDTIHATGEITSEGLDAGSGEITTKGKVSAGDVSTGTLETTGNAKIGGDLTVNGKLNVGEIYMEHKKQESTGEEYDSATSITADGISNNAKVTDKNGVTTESKFTHDKEGSTTYAYQGDAANWKKSTSNVTADGVENVAEDSKGNNNTFTQTSTETKNTLTDKEGNTSTTRQDSKGIYGYAKDKDGNKSYTKQEGNRIAESVIGQDGKQTKSEMTSTDITNTAKDGTITNTAKNVTNEGTESVTNKVGTNEVKVSQGGVDIKVGADTSRTMTDGRIIDKAGDMTVTTDKTTGTTFENGTPNDTTVINGGTIGTNKVNANETNTKKLTAGADDGANGGRLTVDADGVKGSYKSGKYTSKSYILANTLKSGVDNGKDPTDTDFVGSRTDHYMVGDKAKLDETVKDANGSNVTNKTSTGTVTTITDGTGTTTTKTEQTATDITNTAKDGTITNDAKVITNKASEVINNEAININNTATGIIKSKASEIQNQADRLISNKVGENTWENMEDGKITTSIKNGTKQNLTQSDAEKTEHSVVNGSNSTVNKQTSEEITDAVTNGTTTNVTQNTATSSNNTIADKNGNANTVISTADGTSFINSKAAAPVTGASGAGTHLNTTIKGNTITTGKVTMDYAQVMRDLGVNGNANITGKTTTGSLEVTGTSTLKGDVTMESNATVKKNLTVNGITTTKTLKVTENAEIDGNATIKGDVTASSYKVGDKTYISAAGIHANNQKITDVADGSISEGSKDAVNGGQLYNVKNDLEGKVNKVGANAAAMANLHPMEFDPDSKWNIAAAIGNYGSETAAALGAFYRPNDDVMVNLSTAFGTGENMVGGGVSVRLGKGGNKLSREESNALKDQVNDLTARMDALLSVLNPNMSKDFPDVPENHWAYEAVSRLAGNDIVQGYPDGEFHGERTMTRYEMAEIIYNALSRGAEAEKELVEEFKPELQAMAASEKATAERAEG